MSHAKTRCRSISGHWTVMTPCIDPHRQVPFVTPHHLSIPSSLQVSFMRTRFRSWNGKQLHLTQNTSTLPRCPKQVKHASRSVPYTIRKRLHVYTSSPLGEVIVKVYAYNLKERDEVTSFLQGGSSMAKQSVKQQLPLAYRQSLI